MAFVRTLADGLVRFARPRAHGYAVRAWAAALAILLSVLLYRGRRVADDHHLVLDLAASRKKTAGAGGRWSGSILDAANLDFDAEGCAGVVVGVLLVVVAFAAAWLVVELLVPVLFFLAYTVLMKAITRVANDKHDCRGNLARAMGWGLVWTAVYFGPFALAVWIAHAIVRSHGLP